MYHFATLSVQIMVSKLQLKKNELDGTVVINRKRMRVRIGVP